MAKKTANEMMQALIAKRKALEGTDNPIWKTSCIYRSNAMSQRNEFDIRTALAIQLLGGYKSILNHDQACKELGISPMHLGFPIEEWKDDMKLRMRVINRTKILNDIARYAAALRPLLTKSQIRDLDLGEMTDEISAVLEA